MDNLNDLSVKKLNIKETKIINGGLGPSMLPSYQITLIEITKHQIGAFLKGFNLGFTL